MVGNIVVYFTLGYEFEDELIDAIFVIMCSSIIHNVLFRWWIVYT